VALFASPLVISKGLPIRIEKGKSKRGTAGPSWKNIPLSWERGRGKGIKFLISIKKAGRW
jgi:hypothetical protein